MGSAMRSDMKRLMGDKRGSRLSGPRKGRRFSPAEFRKYDWDVDDAPFVGGLVGHALEMSLIGPRRYHRGYNSKPLARYLSSQVGRPWNDVLSAIRAELRGADVVEAYWPGLLTGIVAVKAAVVDGRVMIESWRGRVPLSDPHAPKFYVDPRTGRLHRNTSIETTRMRSKRIAAAKSAELSGRMRELSPHRQLHRLADGNWWEVTLTEIARVPGGVNDWMHDAVLRANLSDYPRETLYGRAGVYATAKRPLSALEIRRYGLR